MNTVVLGIIKRGTSCAAFPMLDGGYHCRMNKGGCGVRNGQLLEDVVSYYSSTVYESSMVRNDGVRTAVAGAEDTPIYKNL